MERKKLTRRLAALILTLGLCAGLSACGGKSSGLSTADAELYVRGLLEENYLGQCDEAYLKLVGIDERTVQATYDNSMALEAENFISMYGIEYPTDELRDELTDMFQEIYKLASFEVVSAAQQEDGSFSVKVNVEPIDIVHLAEEELDDALKPFYEKYTADDVNNMDDASYEAMDQEWAQLIKDAYLSVLPEAGHLETKSASVQLERDEDGYYSITNEDFARLDTLIIDYPAPSEE